MAMVQTPRSPCAPLFRRFCRLVEAAPFGRLFFGRESKVVALTAVAKAGAGDRRKAPAFEAPWQVGGLGHDFLGRFAVAFGLAAFFAGFLRAVAGLAAGTGGVGGVAGR